MPAQNWKRTSVVRGYGETLLAHPIMFTYLLDRRTVPREVSSEMEGVVQIFIRDRKSSEAEMRYMRGNRHVFLWCVCCPMENVKDREELLQGVHHPMTRIA
jgi:aspartyl-tRNA synthetase